MTPIFHSILLELQAVGRAMGFDEAALPPSALDNLKWTRILHQNPEQTFRASILIDIEKGRPMELEVVVGEVIKAANELKVDIPVSHPLKISFIKLTDNILAET